MSQVLKWMYVYEFYKNNDTKFKRDLFIFQRDQLKENCDNLKTKLEIEFKDSFMDPEVNDRSPFFIYKS